MQVNHWWLETQHGDRGCCVLLFWAMKWRFTCTTMHVDGVVKVNGASCSTHLSLGVGDDLTGDPSHIRHGTCNNRSGRQGTKELWLSSQWSRVDLDIKPKWLTLQTAQRPWAVRNCRTYNGRIDGEAGCLQSCHGYVGLWDGGGWSRLGCCQLSGGDLRCGRLRWLGGHLLNGRLDWL